MTLENGYQLQQGRYTIQGVLGEGGMGTVYLATDRNLPGRLVAIKENADASQAAQAQFQQEAVMLARLAHPNLPRVTDHFVEPSGLQYLVMDYVEGDDLREVLRQQGGPLPESLVLSWIEQVMNALEHMHNWIDPATRRPSPIIHRDIKPGNIKRTPNGRIVLVDFGLAKYESDDEPTVVGARAFTPGYSPVEQYSGGTNVRSDIYALGATLYNLLTGQRPPDATALAGGAPLTLPRQVNAQVSRNTERVILRAMQAQENERYQNVRAMRDALLNRRNDATSREPATAPRSEYTLSTYTKRTTRRTPGFIGWLIGLLLLSLIATGLLWSTPLTERWRILLDPRNPPGTAIALVDVSTTTVTTTPTSVNAVITSTMTATPTVSVTATGDNSVSNPMTNTVTNTITNTVTASMNNAPPTIIPLTLTLGATATPLPATTIPTATATATVSPTATATPQPSPTPSPTATSSATTVQPSSTPPPTATATTAPTNTPPPTATLAPTVTNTPTNTPASTATITPRPTATATITLPPTVTATPSATITATVTPTAKPTATVTRTATSEPLPTATATIAPTVTHTPTPRPTATVTRTATATRTATVPPSPTATAAPSATPTATMLPTASATPTAPPVQAPPAAGDQHVNPHDQATYVFVPGGDFLMGSTVESNEQPQHTVTVDSFWISQTEVTNAQYARCVAATVCASPHNDSWRKPDQANFPVTNVDWEQANTYAQWVGGRLPTEAEWEKAARGADGRTFPWGDDVTDEQHLNFNSITGTVAVGSYPAGASPYGALDMAGNVEEWVADKYAPDAYAQSPHNNPTGPTTGILRVVRGGSFKSNRGGVRTSVRGRAAPAINFDNIGFRVVVPSF